MEALIAAAQAEGTLTTIALPLDWCSYGAVIDGFKAKYGLEVNGLDRGAGSAEELEAIEANKGNPGPQAPDVIDVGLAFGPQAKEAGLDRSVQGGDLGRHPGGRQGSRRLLVRRLLRGAFLRGQHVRSGQPAGGVRRPAQARVQRADRPVGRSADLQCRHPVGLGRGLSTGATGEEAAQAGLDFFKQLNEAGNFVPIDGDSRTVGIGETPILIDWSYNSIANDVTLAGNPDLETIVPSAGRLAGVYVQAISAYAPHPNAAKLWMEYLYSDEGQLGWASGFCHPIRFNAMTEAGTIPPEVAEQLPSTEGAFFPTIDEINAATAVITGGWAEVVGCRLIPIPADREASTAMTVGGAKRPPRRRYGTWLGVLPSLSSRACS